MLEIEKAIEITRECLDDEKEIMSTDTYKLHELENSLKEHEEMYESWKIDTKETVSEIFNSFTGNSATRCGEFILDEISRDRMTAKLNTIYMIKYISKGFLSDKEYYGTMYWEMCLDVAKKYDISY